MIKMCFWVHNNNCTNVSTYDSIFCESCAIEHEASCNEAKKASEDAHNRVHGVRKENMGKGKGE